MINDAIKAAVGIGSPLFTLYALRDTWFKSQPVDSSDPNSNPKIHVSSGSKFAPLNWTYASDNHISFNLSDNSVFYAFIPDISLAKDGNADLGIQ